MATIKSYTSLEQSNVLSEILPLESVDMYYFDVGGFPHCIPVCKQDDFTLRDTDIPCWSLSALLNYLREIDFFPDIEPDEHSVTMSINYYNEEEARLLAPVHNIKVEADNFVDACYEIILKLRELKML